MNITGAESCMSAKSIFDNFKPSFTLFFKCKTVGRPLYFKQELYLQRLGKSFRDYPHCNLCNRSYFTESNFD